MDGLGLSRWKLLTLGIILTATMAACHSAAADDFSRPGASHGVGASGMRSASAVQSSQQVPAWSAALEQRGQQRILYAYDLASRGAVHSAQQELFNVLKTVAQTLDTDQGTQRHSEALLSAQIALEESEDFIRTGLRGTRPQSVAALAASHRTTLLHQTDARQLTSVAALQIYFSHAGRQFTIAAEGQPVAAEALFGLGRVAALMRDRPLASGNDDSSMTEQKMLVYYKAAWTIDPRNYRAANELGVLLSRFNQWQQACLAFEYSVAESPEPQNCRNLVVAYERLGEQQLAAAARRKLQSLTPQGAAGDAVASASSSGRIAPAVEWVDLDSFEARGTHAGWNSPAPSESMLGELGGGAAHGPAKTIQAGHSQPTTTDAQTDKPGGLTFKNPLKRLKSVFKRD